jgi:hypothetical protein
MDKSGSVYKLIVSDFFYYGSTTISLNKRLIHHKSYSNNNTNKLCNKIKEIGSDNITIELIETVNYNDRKDLLLRERYYIENNINNEKCLNCNIPYRTTEERRLQQSELHKKKYKENKLNNPKPTKVKKMDDPDYHKKRWKEWADKNREYLREQYKIQDAIRK